MSRVVLALSLVIASVLASRASGQAQTLMSYNFESGFGGWTIDDPQINGLWHVSSNGECGAVTKMAAYNYASSCSFDTGGQNYGYIFSPPFTLSGLGPWTVHFDYRMEMEAFDSAALVGMQLTGPPYNGSWIAFLSNPTTNPTTVQHFTEVIHDGDPSWSGREVRFWVEVGTANSAGDPGFGFQIDNIRMTNSGSITSNGHGRGSPSSPSGSGSLPAPFQSDGGSGPHVSGLDSLALPTSIGAPCSAPTLTWSGSPTLGGSYTVTTENLGLARQVLLVEWSRQAPSASLGRDPSIPCPLYVRGDAPVALGRSPSFTFAIPNERSLVGLHLRTQAVVLGPTPVATQALDAVIGE